MFKGIEKQDFSTFEKFKVAVVSKVIKNLSFNFMEQEIEYTTLSRISEEKLKYFIHNLLNQLPIDVINQINKIESQVQLNNLILCVAGSGKRDEQLNISSGLGLYFSGLTKLCYDSAYVLKLHRNTSFWAQFIVGFSLPDFSPSAVLHFTEYALANILNPLAPVMKAIQS